MCKNPGSSSRAVPQTADARSRPLKRVFNEVLPLLVPSASTRKVYENKLQRMLDQPPAAQPPKLLLPSETQVTHNGNSEADLYSDKEDGEAALATPPGHMPESTGRCKGS